MRVDVSPIQDILAKLKRKDNSTFIAVSKKIHQIAECGPTAICHFKNLKHDFSDYKRAHIGSFILIFRIDGETVIFEKFVHHNDAYKR